MLTRDLLRIRRNGNSLKPLFLKRDDPECLSLAENLIRIYMEGPGRTATELDEEISSCILCRKDLRLARGIAKIVRDRAEFSGVSGEISFPEDRKKLFLHSAELLHAGALPQTASDVRKAVFENTDSPLGKTGIFADLPGNETLLKFKKTFPAEVLDRYNIALVQTLLLSAADLKLAFPASTPPAAVRTLFWKLKFFRLLFSCQRMKDSIHMKIDGPASILEKNLKYGFQLACFFPSVCLLPEWKISCGIHAAGKESHLTLDQTSGLRTIAPQFTSEMEEFTLFIRCFREKRSAWLIDDSPGFFPLGTQKLAIPDFAFRNTAKPERVFPVELFHRWHATPLLERLEYGETHPETTLLVGVERALLKKDGILKKRLDESTFFQKNGFLFRDFPGIETLLKLLEQRNPGH